MGFFGFIKKRQNDDPSLRTLSEELFKRVQTVERERLKPLENKSLDVHLAYQLTLLAAAFIVSKYGVQRISLKTFQEGGRSILKEFVEASQEYFDDYLLPRKILSSVNGISSYPLTKEWYVQLALQDVVEYSEELASAVVHGKPFNEIALSEDDDGYDEGYRTRKEWLTFMENIFFVMPEQISEGQVEISKGFYPTWFRKTEQIEDFFSNALLLRESI